MKILTGTWMLPVLGGLVSIHVLQAQPILNLAFDEGLAGWSISSKGFRVAVDSAISHSGNSLRIERIEKGDFATVSASIPIPAGRYGSLRFNGYIKTDGVRDGYAGLWLRVDGKNGMLAFDNMEGRGATGNTDWAEHEIELAVDSTATQIFFGALLSGYGVAWFDSFRLEIGGHEYESQNEMRSVSKEEVDLLGPFSHSIGSVEPTDFDPRVNEDIRFLGNQIGNRRIVIIGHGTHGTSEIFKMADKITRFLCLTKGFTAIGIESNFPETKTVNDFLQTGEGDAERALGITPYWIWKAEEFLVTLEWMREVNNSGADPLQLFGFDAVDPMVATNRAREIIERHYPPDLANFDDVFEPVKESFAHRNDMSDLERIERFKQLSTGVHRILNQIKTRADSSGNMEEKNQLDWASRYIQIVLQVVQQFVPGLTSREQVMAENVKSFLSRAASNQKVIIWTHNSHAQKYGTNYKPMGSYILDAYPNDVVVIGTLLYEGEYSAMGTGRLNTYIAQPTKRGSLEELLHRTFLDPVMIDVNKAAIDGDLSWLRIPQVIRVIGAREGDQMYSVSNLPKEYDMIIFFNRTTATNLLPSAY